MNHYKKYSKKQCSFSVIDATLASYVQKESCRKNIKTNTTDNKIRNKKRQYDINRKAAKISVLSSGKIDTCEYLTGE